MTGMDIIEAMAGIDPELIRDAKQPEKRIPLWLKWTATAACLCCTVLAVSLSLGHLVHNRETSAGTNALTSAADTFSMEESPSVNTGLQEELEPHESVPESSVDTEPQGAYANGYILIKNDLYDVSFVIPAHYNEALFSINTPLISEADEDIYFENIAISFFDHEAGTYDEGGFIWSIAAWPKEEYTSIARGTEDTLSRISIGSNDRYEFVLLAPDAATQVNTDDIAAMENYYECVTEGVLVLKDFVAYNNITSDGTWLSYYTQNVLNHIGSIYGDQVVKQNTKTLHSEKYGLSITSMALFSDNIQVDTPYIPVKNPELQYDSAVFSFISPNSISDKTDGLIWCILACPKDACSSTGTDTGQEDSFLSSFPLASDDVYNYELMYPGTGSDYLESEDSISEYYSFSAYGYDILESFISENGLTPAEDWKNHYLSMLMDDIRPTPSLFHSFTEEEIESE